LASSGESLIVQELLLLLKVAKENGLNDRQQASASQSQIRVHSQCVLFNKSKGKVEVQNVVAYD